MIQINRLFGGVLIMAMVISGVILGSNSTHACSCIARTYTAQERLDESQGVFVGIVKNVTKESVDEFSDNIVTFEVSKYWKGIGDVTTTEKLRTSSDSAMCGMDFVVGKEYLVFASGIVFAQPAIYPPIEGGAMPVGGIKYQSMLCSGTTETQYAAEIIKALGKAKKPSVNTGNTGGGTSTSSPATTTTPTAPYPIEPGGWNPNAYPASYTFTRNLSLGMTHAEVLLLQQYLNNNGYIVSVTGVGSKGNETNYFGNRTREALIKYQTAHAKNLGIIKGTGYFGPATRAFINSLYSPE